jgi:outer membrane protein assembly factor BamB
LTPFPESSGYSPVAYANGVVYFSSQNGILGAFDAATGAPALVKPLMLDTGAACPASGAPGGVAIARNRLYAFCGPWLVSYGLPA